MPLTRNEIDDQDSERRSRVEALARDFGARHFNFDLADWERLELAAHAIRIIAWDFSTRVVHTTDGVWHEPGESYIRGVLGYEDNDPDEFRMRANAIATPAGVRAEADVLVDNVYADAWQEREGDEHDADSDESR